MDNELEVFDDFVVEDIIPKDIEKELINALLFKLDSLVEITGEIANSYGYKAVGIPFHQQVRQLLDTAIEVCNAYVEYCKHCRENMEM